MAAKIDDLYQALVDASPKGVSVDDCLVYYGTDRVERLHQAIHYLRVHRPGTIKQRVQGDKKYYAITRLPVDDSGFVPSTQARNDEVGGPEESQEQIPPKPEPVEKPLYVPEGLDGIQDLIGIEGMEVLQDMPKHAIQTIRDMMPVYIKGTQAATMIANMVSSYGGAI